MQCSPLPGSESSNAPESTCLGAQSLRKEVCNHVGGGHQDPPYVQRLGIVKVGQNTNLFSKAQDSLQAADILQEDK